MIKKAFSLFSNDMDECFSVPLAGRPIERPFLKNGNCGPPPGNQKTEISRTPWRINCRQRPPGRSLLLILEKPLRLTLNEAMLRGHIQ